MASISRMTSEEDNKEEKEEEKVDDDDFECYPEYLGHDEDMKSEEEKVEDDSEVDQEEQEHDDGATTIINQDTSSARSRSTNPQSSTTATTTSTTSERNKKKRRYHYRLGLVLFSALYTTFFAGAFFGWGPMQLLLEEDSAFAFKCDDGYYNQTNSFESDVVCPEQTQSLLNVHFVASLMMILTPLTGHLADIYGPLVLMRFTSFIGCLGICLLILSRAIDVDQLLYVAFACLAMMAFSTSVMVMQTGMVFDTDKSRRRVISALNNLFDAGSVTYLFLWEIYEATGASIEILASGYLGFAVFCFGGALIFWKLLRDHEKEPSSKEVEERNAEEVVSEDVADPNDKEKNDNDNDKSTGYTLIALRLPWQQLTSTQLLMLAAYFSFHICRNMFMLTTARDFLAYLGDDDNTYLTIFTLMMPASILGFPLVDAALHRFGYHVGLQLVNALAAIHGIIQVSSTNLNVQVLGFVVFSFYRCFLFSVVFSFLPNFLGREVVGKANGLLQVSAGLTSFLNIPLSNAAINKWDGNFFIPNLIYTVLVIPFCYAAYVMGKGIRLEETEKSKSMRFTTTEEHSSIVKPGSNS